MACKNQHLSGGLRGGDASAYCSVVYGSSDTIFLQGRKTRFQCHVQVMTWGLEPEKMNQCAHCVPCRRLLHWIHPVIHWFELGGVLVPDAWH